MKFWKLASAATVLVLSTSSNAAIITYGHLTTDDTTNYITDTNSGRQYLRFDTFNLTYADTVAATSTGGIFEDWSIATSDVADSFYAAALRQYPTSCGGQSLFGQTCGNMASWVDGVFGASFSDTYDFFWYLSTNTTPDRPELDIGLGRISPYGDITDWDDWGDIAAADFYGFEDTQRINALLYRDVSAVPIPAAAWLFGSGLIGLAGVTRRKK